MHKHAAALATAALTATLTLTAAPAPADPPRAFQPTPRAFQPCKYEDGSGQVRCVWDAVHMGNGTGQSALIRRGGTDDARYTDVTHRRAHRVLTRWFSITSDPRT